MISKPEDFGLIEPRHEMSYLGPIGCMNLARYIHETGKQVQDIRAQIQANEDAAMAELYAKMNKTKS